VLDVAVVEGVTGSLKVGEGVAGLLAVQLGEDPPPELFIGDVVEHGDCANDAPDLADGLGQGAWLAAALESLDQLRSQRDAWRTLIAVR
jgi:hypothetical protein